MPTVAINGLGRIGRAALKILLDSDGLEVAAVNDIAAADNLAYLLRYDTVYGRYHRQVSAEDGALVVDDRRIPVFAERDPSALPWGDLGVDLVLECTKGRFDQGVGRQRPDRNGIRDVGGGSGTWSSPRSFRTASAACSGSTPQNTMTSVATI
jgi:glyceraldehyde-3-phosphate dehydrogenase/erythrose-4-phosphate dehydrogenase